MGRSVVVPLRPVDREDVGGIGGVFVIDIEALYETVQEAVALLGVEKLLPKRG